MVGTDATQGSPPAAAGLGRVRLASTFENAIWSAAANANEGNVPPTGILRRAITKYNAAPGIQLANAGHRHRGAASKNAAAGQGPRRTAKESATTTPSRGTNNPPMSKSNPSSPLPIPWSV